jgi:folate-binding protein YgfZ
VLYGDDVRVTDASSQVAVTRLLGPGADGVVARLLPSAASPVGPRGPHGTWIEAELEAAPLWVMGHDPLCGLGGIDLVAPVGAPESALANRLEALGAEPWTRSHLEAARVEAGLPAFPREIDGRANPLELGLRAVVDFAKGCYIGQEVVARLDAYDKVRRTLVVIESDGPIAEGDALEPSEAASAVPGSRQPAPVGSGSPVTVRTVAEPPAAASSAAGPAPHAPPARRALALVPAAWATASGLVARSDRASMPVRIVAVAATLRTASGLLDSLPERPV